MTAPNAKMHANDPTALKDLKVIVVDDDHSMRDLLCTVLRGIGMHVVGEGSSGQVAARLYQQHQPDVICLDIEMPGVSGLDALREIRSLDNQATILMITAATTADNVRSAIDGGASGIVAKPFSSAKIAAELKRIRSLPRAPRET
jgi:two-component system chemotaxis response regulator CheY